MRYCKISSKNQSKQQSTEEGSWIFQAMIIFGTLIVLVLGIGYRLVVPDFYNTMPNGDKAFGVLGIFYIFIGYLARWAHEKDKGEIEE